MQLVLILVTLAMGTVSLHAHEKIFGTVTSVEAMPADHWEVEQSLVNSVGKADGIYSKWTLREELEYGLTQRWTTAAYLNLNSVSNHNASPHSGEETGSESGGLTFQGVSWENRFQVLNPRLDVFGFAPYAELTWTGTEGELEQKYNFSYLLGDRWELGLTMALEHEWRLFGDHTDRELRFEGDLGLSCKLSSQWSFALETSNRRVFPDFDVTRQENSAWYAGPNLHYGNERYWWNFMILPQIYGEPNDTVQGDNGSGGVTDVKRGAFGRNLTDHELMEIRITFGIFLG